MSARSSAPLADHNAVQLLGTVRTSPERHPRPGGEACCFELDVEVPAGGTAARVPVAWVASTRTAGIVRPGTRVAIAGVLRPRFFRAEGRTLARLEVIADAVVPARRREPARALIGPATA